MRALAAIWLAPIVLVAAAGACSSRGVLSTAGAGAGGAGSAGTGGAATGGGGAAGSGGLGGAAVNGTGGGPGNGCENIVCGPVVVSVGRRSADVLIVLDSSASMGGAQWTSMTGTLKELVSSAQGQINWGLKYFSNDGACGAAGPPEIPPVANNAAAIAASMAAARPGGNTPLRFALQAASAYLTALMDGNARYIVLATDGAANCCTTAGGASCPPAPADSGGESSAADVANAIAAVAATYDGGAGIPVFVVGAGGPGAATTALNSMAVAGGEAQAPDALGRRYFSADNPGALESAAMNIPGMVAPCTFTLPAAPPDQYNIVVLVDNKRVPADGANGWSYGPGMTTIVLNGATCDVIEAGADHRVEVIFACPSCPIMIP